MPFHDVLHLVHRANGDPDAAVEGLTEPLHFTSEISGRLRWAGRGLPTLGRPASGCPECGCRLNHALLPDWPSATRAKPKLSPM